MSVHDYWRNHSLDYLDLCWQNDTLMSLLFNILSSFIIAFLPRSKHLLILWLQITVCNDFGTQEIKICHCFHFSPSICHEVMGPDAMILVFWMLSFKPAFSLSSFTLIKRLVSFSSLSAARVVSSAYLRLLIFLPAIIKVKMRSWEWDSALIWWMFLLEEEMPRMCTHKFDRVRTGREGGRLQAWGTGLRRNQTSYTWVLGFRCSELWDISAYCQATRSVAFDYDSQRTLNCCLFFQLLMGTGSSWVHCLPAVSTWDKPINLSFGFLLCKIRSVS